MNFDLDDLTLEEVEILEDVAGVAMEALPGILTPKEGEAPKPKARILTAMAYIAARRANPEVTLAEVKAMKVSAIFPDADGEAAPARPTEASAQ